MRRTQCNEVGHISRNCPQNVGGAPGGYGQQAGGCAFTFSLLVRARAELIRACRRTAGWRLRRRIRSSWRTVRWTRQDLRSSPPSSSSSTRADGLNGQYTCGGVGHLSRDCTTQQKCFNCGQTGHISRDCTSAAQAKACVRPPLSLLAPPLTPFAPPQYNCGESGHISRECPAGQQQQQAPQDA